MKTLSYRLMVSLFVVALAFSLGYPAYAQQQTFAYVDVAKLFDEYEKTKDNDRVLQQKGRQKEEERDAIVHEVRQLKDELLLLTDDAKASKQSTLEGKIRELQSFDEEAKNQLGEERRNVVRTIFKDIDDTVQRYGERKGIDFIFNERALLYRGEQFDITADVLKELNKGYSKNN